MPTQDNQQTEPAQSALKAVAEAARQLFAADLCLIAPVNPVTRQLYAPLFVAAGDGGALAIGERDDARLIAMAQSALEVDEPCGQYHAEGIGDERPLAGLEGVRSLFVIPLRAPGDNKPLALLWLGFLQPRSFTAEDKGRLDSFREQFTPFLQNVWQSKRLQQVVLMGQEINQALGTVEQLFRTVRNRVADILDVSYFFMLALYHPQTRSLDLYHSFKGEQSIFPDIALQGACGWVINKKAALTVASRDDHPNADVTTVQIESTADSPESLIFVPLMLRNVALGVLSVQHPSPHVYDASDLQIITLIANQIALAIDNLRLFDHLQSLNETGQSLTQQMDSAELSRMVVERILEATGADVVILYPYDQASARFERATASGTSLGPEFSEQGETQPNDIARLALANAVPLYATDSTHLYELLGGEAAGRRGNFEQREAIASTAVLPLRVGDETAGVLFVNYRQPQLFDATRRMLIESLANYAAIAVRNTRTFLALARRRIEELEALHEIERKVMTQMDDPDQVMRTVLVEAMTLTGAESGDLYLLDEGRVATTYCASMENREIPPPRRYAGDEGRPIQRGIVAHVSQTFEPYLTNNTANDMFYVGGTETRSEAAIPLFSDKELIGVLNVESKEPHAFNADDVGLLQLFAGQAVIAIRQARIYAQARAEAMRFRLLWEAGQSLAEITGPEQLDRAYEIVINKVGEFSDSEVIIRRYDPGTQELVLARVGRQRPTKPLRSIPKSEGVNGQVARELRTIYLSDINNLPSGVAQPIGDDPAIKSLIVTPLVFESSYYGNLVLNHEIAYSFGDADIMLIKGLAQQLAITINRLETFQARMEAERRANEVAVMSQLGQSAMELTHRLANELGLVKVYVNSTLRAAEAQGIEGGPIRDNLDKITRDVTNVLSMSRRLKDTAVGIGELDRSSERSMTSVHHLLEDARRSLKPLPPNVSLIWPSDAPHVEIPVVPGQIMDILYNLITNAVEAMPDGGTVAVRASTSNSAVLIEVSDSGPGVSEQVQAKLFRLFYSTKKSSGFGLWSARQYARANGGDLSYEQRTGGGATFVLRLPLMAVREGIV